MHRLRAMVFTGIDPVLLGTGFGIAVVSGVVAGLFSSLRAARLVPVEAIRTI
jgi:putative ABC transport system permease protein